MGIHQPPHIILVVFPMQSHINPALQFAAHLLRSSALVTIATTVAGTKRMTHSGGSPPPGLSFATISDGFDDGINIPAIGTDTYLSTFKRRGSETLSALVAAASPPYTCVAYTFFLSWVADVARRHNLPSALLWIQNAALLSIYYHYFNGYGDVIDNCDENDPEWTIKLPSLPPLYARDLPSYLTPSNGNKFATGCIREQLEELKKDENPRVLINSFDSLEHEVIESLNEFFNISAIGPLLSPSFLQERRVEKGSFRVEMFTRPEVDYVAWLDTKADSSVVYVSFGSIFLLSRAQLEELAAALLDSGRPFLWVIRPKVEEEKEKREEDEKLSRWEELQEKGMVVPWCTQVEVLSHRAVGCFVTHCGWNSTLESLAAGMPVVAVPQHTDQLTNAKMLESVWKTGVRVKGGSAVEEKVVGREEIRRCMKEVMESEVMRRNARRWREKAVEAAKEGGLSEVNLKEFVQDVWRMLKTTRPLDADKEEI